MKNFGGKVEMKKMTSVLVLLFSIVLLAACGNSSSGDKKAKAAEDQDKVIQHFGGPGNVQIYELAEGLGYYDTIKLENVGTSKGGPSDIQLVSSGDIDVGLSFNGAVIKAAAQNIKVKSVVSAYGSDKVYNQKFYVLEDSKIKSAKDLIGKKVGVNTLGAQGDFLVSEYLRQGGLTKDEIAKVELVTIPWTNGEQALRAKQIDVAYFDTELATVAEEHGGVRELFTDIDLFGPYAGVSLIFSDAYIAENPETVKEFVGGIAKAFEWTKEHSKEEVIAKYKEILKKRNKGETEAYAEAYLSKGVEAEGGAFTDKDWSIWLEWLKKNSDFNVDKVDVSKVYTNEFNPYAK